MAIQSKFTLKWYIIPPPAGPLGGQAPGAAHGGRSGAHLPRPPGAVGRPRSRAIII